jgi:hypothetical protein
MRWEYDAWAEQLLSHAAERRAEARAFAARRGIPCGRPRPLRATWSCPASILSVGRGWRAFKRALRPVAPTQNR